MLMAPSQHREIPMPSAVSPICPLLRPGNQGTRSRQRLAAKSQINIPSRTPHLRLRILREDTVEDVVPQQAQSLQSAESWTRRRRVESQ